jgi:uncharacterized protein YbbK (DUF523 family)
LQQHFELLPVCPEVEIGLPVPRPPVQLSGDIMQPRMTGRDDATIDITDTMRTFCKNKPSQLKNICGYVFKSRSPSCGLKSVPLFRDGNTIATNLRGLFAQTIVTQWPNLPVAEEIDLQTIEQRRFFIEQALAYWQTHKLQT